MLLRLIGLLLLVGGLSSVFAQSEDCPSLVQSALDVTGNACEALGRNQVCYGNTTVTLEFRQPDAPLAFDAPGDTASVVDIQGITLSSMDNLFRQWGVALMKLQAQLPETLPGENVTFVLFGDVQIMDAAPPPQPEPVMLQVTANNSANVRSGPGRNNAVVGALASGQTVTADGRNQAADWLRIQLEDGSTGWVFAQLVTSEGDLSTLPVVEAASATPPPAPRPLENFYLRTGPRDSRCVEAPSSGVLIQSPQGWGRVQFTINGVRIRFNSTVYIQAPPGGPMTLNVLEGQINVSVNNVDVWVPAGASIDIPLDANGLASASPGAPQPHTDLTALGAPVELLPLAFPIQPPITAEVLADYQELRLVSDRAGNACVPGGLTVSQLTSPDESSRRTTASTVGSTWHARAGVTATFVAGSTARIRSSSTPGLIYLRPPATDSQPFAVSATNTLTYTFAEDTEFRLWVAGGGGDLLTATVTCDN
jgi:hypothetical protein